MRQTIDIKLPTCWLQLSDNQLRFVFNLLNGNYSLPQVKALCLLKWAKIKILRREGGLFIVKYNRQRFPVSALQITEATSAMQWLGNFPCQREQTSSLDLPSAAGKLRSDFPVYPVRFSRIGFHRPIAADFQGVQFGTFLALDNLCNFNSLPPVKYDRNLRFLHDFLRVLRKKNENFEFQSDMQKCDTHFEIFSN